MAPSAQLLSMWKQGGEPRSRAFKLFLENERNLAATEQCLVIEKALRNKQRTNVKWLRKLALSYRSKHQGSCRDTCFAAGSRYALRLNHTGGSLEGERRFLGQAAHWLSEEQAARAPNTHTHTQKHSSHCQQIETALV